MITALEKHPLKIIVLVGTAIFLIHLGVMPVSIMEARNFITAREMLTDGNWLLTTLNGLPRYQKPPLPTWITAIFGSVFGISNVYGFRLPTALMAIFLSVNMYFFSMLIFTKKNQALINALILITSAYFIAITIEAPWDIYTHGFMFVTIYFLYQFFKSVETDWKAIIIAAVFAGGSLMSKGPVSLYTLFLPFVVAYGIVYKYRHFNKKWFPLICFFVLAIAIGFWWFAYVWLTDPEAFLKIAQKETGNWGSYHVRPFYYYWSFFSQTGIWAIPALMSLLYPYLRKKVSNIKAYRFTLLWTVLAVILLSIIPEKKNRYLVPVLIPLAMNTGIYLEYLFKEFSNLNKKRETFPVYFHFGLMALMGLIFPVAGYVILKDQLAGRYLIYFILTSIALVAIGFLIIRQLKKMKLKPVFFLSVALLMSVIAFGLPLVQIYNKNVAFRSIKSLRQEEQLPIYVYQKISPEMLWDYGTSLPIIKQKSVITYPRETAFGMLVDPKQIVEFERSFGDRYDMKDITIYDINHFTNRNERGYKSRLVSHYYILNEKDL